MNGTIYDNGELFASVPSEAPFAVVIMQTAIYGYVLFVAANMIGDGADLLLLIPSYAPYVGTIVIPILGAVPDGMIVLCSGLGKGAQEKLSTGIGALAGSTIMLLTLPWFLAVWSGRVSFVDKTLTYKRPKTSAQDWTKLRKGYAGLFSSGVAITDATRHNALIMLATATSFFWIQVPAYFYDKPGKPITSSEIDHEHTWAWVGLVASVTWFVYYMVKMLVGANGHSELGDKIVQKQVAAIQRGEITIQGVMAKCNHDLWNEVVTKGCIEASALREGGRMQREISQMCELLGSFFTRYDTSKDGYIGFDEFRFLLKELNTNLDYDEQKTLFNKINVHDQGLDFDSFIAFTICYALQPQKENKEAPRHTVGNPKLLMKKKVADDAEIGSDDGDDEDAEEENMPDDLADLSPEMQQSQLTKRAFSKMFLGTGLVLLFSDPMCDLLTVIGDKLEINTFFVGFLLAPLASNASEMVAAMRLASKKTVSSMENSLASLEGAAIMNNTFCLAIFMFLIIFQGLAWRFTAETISILAAQVMVALIVFSGAVHTLFKSLLVLMCYPLSLVLVLVLESQGWD